MERTIVLKLELILRVKRSLYWHLSHLLLSKSGLCLAVEQQCWLMFLAICPFQLVYEQCMFVGRGRAGPKTCRAKQQHGHLLLSTTVYL